MYEEGYELKQHDLLLGACASSRRLRAARPALTPLPISTITG